MSVFMSVLYGINGLEWYRVINGCLEAGDIVQEQSLKRGLEMDF